jgi:hypothetical protein
MMHCMDKHAAESAFRHPLALMGTRMVTYPIHRPKNVRLDRIDCRGHIPESWACVDCGVNTAPGCSNRVQLEKAFSAGCIEVMQTVDDFSELYMVKGRVWKAAHIMGLGGCLCIGCLEKRLGRELVFKDFSRNHPFRFLPGTVRLLSRRDGPPQAPQS